MDALRIHGGKPLFGTVGVSGAKNAALPIMTASLLMGEPVRLSNVPAVRDVATLSHVLYELGRVVAVSGPNELTIEQSPAPIPIPHRASAKWVRRMRAGFC